VAADEQLRDGAFVDFCVYYLVHVPYADVFAVERFMHRALPGRRAFPIETKERGSLSEWLDCSQRDLRRDFRDLAKDSVRAEPHRRLPRH
jgi:hypothetical protein